MTSKESGALASDHGTTEIKSKKPPVPLPILPVQATKPGWHGDCMPPPLPPKPTRQPFPQDRSHSMKLSEASTIFARRGSENAPPKVPLRSQRSRLTFSESPPPAEKHSQQHYEFLSSPLSLQELVNTYSKRFPLQIMVTRGYRGQTPELTICNADVYNVHFLKHREVICIRDKVGHVYSVPLNTSVQFGLLYKQEGKSANTPIFQKVSDIWGLKQLPKVVRATGAWEGSDKESSVKENEILVIKRVHRPMFRGKSLEVFSLSTKSTKVLPSDCKGIFSTDPSLIPLYLPEIVEHIPDPFPCQAVMILNEEFTEHVQCISSSLLNGTITMIKRKMETSLVASSYYDPVSNPEQYNKMFECPLLDIPLDDCFKGVEVAVIKSKDKKQVDHLYEYTQDVLVKFDPSKLKSYRDAESRKTYETQSVFYSTLRSGSEKYGVVIDVPTIVHSHAEAPKLLYNQTKSPSVGSQMDNVYEPLMHSDSSEDDYNPSTQFLHFPASQPPKQVVPPSLPNDETQHKLGCTYSRQLPPKQMSPFGEYSQARGRSRTIGISKLATLPLPPTPVLQAESNAAAQTYDYITVGEDTHKGEMLAEMKELISDLTTKVHSLQKEGPPPAVKSEGESVNEMNRSYLSTLTIEQVQHMLEGMSLTQYNEVFAREQISGEVLVELDDDTLREDLGISNRVHRIRIMMVISGRKSIQDTMN